MNDGADRDGKEGRFTLLDAMVLVAATAAGLTMFRGNPMRVYLHLPETWAFTKVVERGFFWVAVIVPCTVTWMLALLILRLRRPRPRLRRIARQPGSVACFAAVSVTVVGLAVQIPSTIAMEMQGGTLTAVNPSWALYLIFVDLPTCISYAVAASWATLALGGRWRPEPGWIDRIGRTLGFFWLALILIYPWITVVI
jgi:hypothetical protein